jgi:hypothetical protein
MLSSDERGAKSHHPYCSQSKLFLDVWHKVPANITWTDPTEDSKMVSVGRYRYCVGVFHPLSRRGHIVLLSRSVSASGPKPVQIVLQPGRLSC